jgi:outer membrane protein OmpA-like peptidoglycan-associated protein
MTVEPALADKPLPAEPEPNPVLDGTRPQSAALVASARETPAAPVASPQESTSLRPASARQESPAPERELARLGVSLSRLADGTVHVNLRRQVPFDFNSAEVRPESRPFLDRLAEALRRLDGFVVRVVGLTDDSGTRDYNAQLSRRRAEAVAAYLRQQGVPADRLRAEGRGVGEPTAEIGGIADGGADRRRIELYIQPLTNGRA